MCGDIVSTLHSYAVEISRLLAERARLVASKSFAVLQYESSDIKCKMSV